ncbi:hypothetical protein SAMN06265374_3756 [Roseibium denhamense]|uniref:Uncharacterized protein n=1 Tax=Roseibium denhamense TaxID=76305 RepID=A0ABY1PIE8_9HYPH|nr:hypothetical protein SAMN06265374_3756 [Roseibium denhamense]
MPGSHDPGILVYAAKIQSFAVIATDRIWGII